MNNMIYKEEVYQIIGAAFEVYNTLGPGFLEAVYEEALKIEFEQRGIPFESQKRIQVYYKRYKLDKEYQADFVCYNEIVVETKATDKLHSTDDAQILNYLKAVKLKLGILLNFGNPHKLEWKRLVL